MTGRRSAGWRGGSERDVGGVRAAAGTAVAAVIAAGLLGLPTGAPAQESDRPDAEPAVAGEPDIHPVPAAGSEVRIDGVLDEPAWERAARFELPWEWTPGDNVPAPVDTECFVTHDDDQLYLACRAHDPEPDRIRAHLADRDTPFGDDHVIFLLDTFDDRRRAFQFRINPYGVQMDALLSQGFEDFSWDAIWDSDGRITEAGYVVEAAVPFKSLSFQATDGPQTWGFIVERSWPRSARHRMRNVRTDRADPCLLCQAVELRGFEGVKPGRDVEFNPTLTASRTDSRESLGAPSLDAGDVDAEVGLNVRWRVTSNVALDATVNPDFSQVEADAAQLEVNRRFALFFPEKRPFFLEGADIFDVPARLIFTRSVVDPIAGAKVSGKVGGNAVGVFATVDEVNSLIFPGPRGSSRTLLEDDVAGGVFRYRRDVGGSSTVGFFSTLRQGDGYHNRLFATDGDIRLGRSDFFTWIVAHTRTRYPEEVAAAFGQPGEEFTAEGFALSYRHSGRNLTAFAEYNHVEPELRADAGFLPQTGLRGPGGGVFYTFWGGSDRWFNRIQAGGVFQRHEDFDGEVLSREFNLSANYQGPLQSFVDLDLSWERETFAGKTFDTFLPQLFVRLRPSGAVSLGVRAGSGTGIDFANARRADRFVLGPSLELRPGARTELELRHDLERLGLEGERIFLANLSQARVLYHFSRRAFLRAILQYRNVRRNPALHEDPVEASSEALFTQLLFSYKVNPRTVLFAGYSDNRRGVEDVSLTQTGRSFFLKLGYAWRP